MKMSYWGAPWVGALAAAGAMLGSHTAHAQSCESDGDCPETMRCFEQTAWECDGGGAGTGAGGTAGGAAGTAGMFAGAGGDIGGSGGAPECHEVPAESVCVPRYQLPCEAPSDCGGCFDCVENVYWMCSGGGGTTGSAGTGAGGDAEGGIAGAAGMSDEGSCEPVPSGDSSCVLQVLPCQATTDCPAGLECNEQYVYPPCTGGEAGTGAGGTSGTSGTSGTAGMGAGTISCPDPIVELRCTPIYDGGGMGGTGGGGIGGDVGGDDGGMAGTSGVGGSAGIGGAAGTGTGSAGTGETDEDGHNDENHGHHGHGRGRGLLKRLLHGCSAAGPVSGGGSSGWLMLGLAALVVRRRTRRA